MINTKRVRAEHKRRNWTNHQRISIALLCDILDEMRRIRRTKAPRPKKKPKKTAAKYRMKKVFFDSLAGGFTRTVRTRVK